MYIYIYNVAIIIDRDDDSKILTCCCDQPSMTISSYHA